MQDLPNFTAGAPLIDQIDCWIFDLDNTLYHPRAALFDLIDARMGAYIARLLDCDAVEARRVQKDYFHNHGTTMAGLMANHGVDPEHFLDDVHAIALDRLTPDPALRAALSALPGRRIIFTNGDADYAGRVLAALGIADLFAATHDIRATAYVPKPQPSAYASLCAAHAIAPSRALFVEDLSRNLPPAKALGMTTVWLDNGSESGHRGHDPAHVDHHIHDLAAWLGQVTQTGTAPTP
jgi:putative hydrolase of the HAD superfamily